MILESVPTIQFLEYGLLGSYFFVIVFYSSIKQRLYKIITASLMMLVLIGHFMFNRYSLLMAE